jgi:mono/diheme cytochrome c family protein
LFRNKGCATCHVNNRVDGASGVLGPSAPDLTAYRNSPEFLRPWLADPKQVRPNAVMPDLRLTAAEIDDLIAFLNEPR